MLKRLLCNTHAKRTSRSGGQRPRSVPVENCLRLRIRRGRTRVFTLLEDDLGATDE